MSSAHPYRDAGINAGTIMLVAAGGFCGTLARALLDEVAAATHLPWMVFAWSTVLVNLLGAFLLGFVNARFASGCGLVSLPPTKAKPLFSVGFLGAFTTYATLALVVAETARGFQGLALIEALVTMLFGLLLALLGSLLGESHGSSVSPSSPGIQGGSGSPSSPGIPGSFKCMGGDLW